MHYLTILKDVNPQQTEPKLSTVKPHKAVFHSLCTQSFTGFFIEPTEKLVD